LHRLLKCVFWNIGAEGQVLVGGIATAACMIYFGGQLPTWLLLILMFVISAVAGAIWGVIPAFFKSRFKTNETLFTLMMNYVAIQLTSFFVAKWENPYGSNTVGIINQSTQTGWFPSLFGQHNLLNVIIVLMLTVIMFIYLRYSKQGYEISVVGESERTAKYIGINVRKVIVRTMTLSGAICGLAGFIAVAGASHTISISTAGGRGFTAIIVAWLAKFNTFVMILVSALLVFLEKGSIQIASQYNLNDYASQMITGIILFFILGSEFFVNYRSCSVKKRRRNEMTQFLSLLQAAIVFGTVILFGAMGEILTEKSGNLNLGVPGIMYMGGIAGLAGAFFYENVSADPNAAVGLLIALICALVASALAGLLYSFLTITLRANQNVTGLTLTIFGSGVANLFGGAMNKMAGGVGQISVATTSGAFRATLPFLSGVGVFSGLGFMVYAAIIIAVVSSRFLNRTRKGLNLRAVGENPATADAAGISVTKYKYLAITTVAAITGMGGLYYVMDYIRGTWANDGGIEKLGWLAVALVILPAGNPRTQSGVPTSSERFSGSISISPASRARLRRFSRCCRIL
jgi:simple sugar transport system permease protein